MLRMTNSLAPVLRGEGWGEGLSRKWTRLFSLVTLVMTFTACNLDSRPPRAPVTGTVTYRGLPLANAHVSFIPATTGQQIATGVTNEQGKFTLTTLDLNDGAFVGSHKVQIIAHGPDRPLR